MNVNEVKPGGLGGPERPDRGRLERVDAKRRNAEARRPAESVSPREEDRVEFSARGEEVERLERRARELALRVAREDGRRRERIEGARRNLERIAGDREFHERAAAGLLQELRQERARS